MQELMIRDIADKLGYGRLQCFFDKELDFACVIALHSTNLGPAIGGCRCVYYDNFQDTVIDALNLGHAMSLKASIHGLKHGGGKAVVMKPKELNDRQAFFAKLGECVNYFDGDYITAVDSGTKDEDMAYIAQSTKYVLAPQFFKRPCTPSIFTAQGVYNSIIATSQHLFNHSELSKLTMMIQGLGNVGKPLMKQLAADGVKLLITDDKKEYAKELADEFGATYVDNQNCLTQPCDLIIPCALGGILNDETIPDIQAAGIVGCANNIFLDDVLHSQLAHDRGLLCVPDYVANGGGLIHVADLYANESLEETQKKITNIGTTVSNILDQSATNNLPPIKVANTIAQNRITESNYEKV